MGPDGNVQIRKTADGSAVVAMRPWKGAKPSLIQLGGGAAFDNLVLDDPCESPDWDVSRDGSGAEER
jgi:hypothetical protein